MSAERRSRLRWIIAALLTVATAMTLLVRYRLEPLAEDLISLQVDNQASDAINAAIAEQIAVGNIDYANMVVLDTDVTGTVTAVRTNMSELNRLKTDILQTLDAHLESMTQEELSVPIGSLLFPELFSGRGASVPIRVLAVRSTDAEFRNSFTSAGINQTLHRMMIDVKVDITVLTWTNTFEISVESSVVAAETVIVGTVPTTYFGLEASE